MARLQTMAKEAPSQPWLALGRAEAIYTEGGGDGDQWLASSPRNMDRKVIFITFACLLALSLAAPAEKADAEVEAQDLAAGDKEDLKTAASHWGGHYGGWGGWGGWGYGGYGGHYPYYGSWGWGWGWPSYGYGGYGYWPYGGYHGHHGYGWW